MMDGWTRSELDAEGFRHPVWRRGDGPAVVVLPEVPGVTPEVRRFAEAVVDAGFTVYLGEVFGRTLEPRTPGSVARTLARACVSREFTLLTTGQSSPLTAWVRALCRLAHAERGGVGVGVIGMCLTGNFALAAMVDPAVAAPVLSQPSLPFGITARHRACPHLSDAELAAVKARVAGGAKVLGLRFTHDPLCPAARFDRLQAELGDGFERIDVDSSPGNAAGVPLWAHSVVTNDLVDVAGHPTRAALDRVIGFFGERLRG